MFFAHIFVRFHALCVHTHTDTHKRRWHNSKIYNVCRGVIKVWFNKRKLFFNLPCYVLYEWWVCLPRGLLSSLLRLFSFVLKWRKYMENRSFLYVILSFQDMMGFCMTHGCASIEECRTDAFVMAFPAKTCN